MSSLIRWQAALVIAVSCLSLLACSCPPSKVHQRSTRFFGKLAKQLISRELIRLRGEQNVSTKCDDVRQKARRQRNTSKSGQGSDSRRFSRLAETGCWAGLRFQHSGIAGCDCPGRRIERQTA